MKKLEIIKSELLENKFENWEIFSMSNTLRLKEKNELDAYSLSIDDLIDYTVTKKYTEEIFNYGREVDAFKIFNDKLIELTSHLTKSEGHKKELKIIGKVLYNYMVDFINATLDIDYTITMNIKYPILGKIED